MTTAITGAAHDSPALAAVGLEKTYGRQSVLRGADLQVGPRESVAILGRSGSGKTTLLRIVAGLESHDRGSVSVGGRDVSHAPPHSRGLGYVFQRSALWPHLTVADNIMFGVPRAKGRDARRRILEELVERLEIQGLEGRYPAGLSGGEARRVAIARALAPSPRLLLLDEAFTHLDWDLKARLIDLINGQVRGSAALLYVTHDPDEALQVADRQLELADGRLAPWTGADRG